MRYNFKPQPDMTAFELALILQAVESKLSMEQTQEFLTPECLRHLEEVE